MKVNKTLINIETIYDDCTISEIWALLDTLLGVSDDLEGDKEIRDINEQLYYVRANISTLRLALTAHEEEISTAFFNKEIIAPTYWN